MQWRFLLGRRTAAGILVLLGSATLSHAEEYKIALNRPEKVGQRFTIHATGHSKQAATFTVPGVGPQKQGAEFAMELDGTIKVLAVDDKSGQPTKVECTIAKCLKEQKPLLDPGTVLVAENKDGKTAFTKDGADLDPMTADALGVVIDTHQPGAPSDDQMFGTDKPQKVGDTWPVNAEAASASAAKSGITIAPDKIKGEGKLVAVKQVDGRQALEVQATMNVTELSMPQQKVDSGTFTAQFGGVFPTDDAAYPISSSQSMQVHMKMTVAANGQSIPVDTDVERSNQITYGPATDK